MRFPFRLTLLLAAVLLVPACGTQKRKNPPVITFTSPAGGDGNIPLAPIIYIRYDKALDPSTIPGTFLLMDATTNIPCTVSYNPVLFEVRMVPTGALASNTIYQVTILAGLKSTDGAAVEVTLFFQFTTKTATDNQRPSSPSGLSAGSITSNSITLTWTASTDNIGVDHYDIFMSVTAGAEDLTSRLMVGTSPQVVGSLSANTTYYFIVRAVDAEGNTDLNETPVQATTLP